MAIQDPSVFPTHVYHPTKEPFWCPDIEFLKSMKDWEGYELQPFTGPRKHIPFKGCVECLKLKASVADLELKLADSELEHEIALQDKDNEIKALKAALKAKKP